MYRLQKVLTGVDDVPVLVLRSICGVTGGFLNFILYSILALQNKRRLESMSSATISTIRKKSSVSQ